MKILKVMFLVLFLLSSLPLFVFSAGVKADEKFVNVLCYHRFKERKPSEITNKKLGDIYSISPKRFDEQMAFLKDNGYNVISMSNYLLCMEGKAELPDKAVIISTDDGYSSVKDFAYPILKKYKFPSISYVYSVFMPVVDAKTGRSKHSNAMTDVDIKAMHDEGLMEFGSHSYTHPVMTKRGDMTDEQYCDFLITEIIKSKRYLERKLGFPIETLAYPYGAYSKEIMMVAEKAGYKAALSVAPSYNTIATNRYALKRTMVYNSTTIDKFKKILDKKPMKIKVVSPGDGDIITDGKTILKAELEEDSGLNTSTIRFVMGRVVLDDSKYDAQTKTLTYVYDKPLPHGVHDASVTAKDVEGNVREYAWMFEVGKPIKEGVLEAALSKIDVPKGAADAK
jgi:peptidoglycan/xylan/chitin deacetylase (PgdA/CDA1 family)